MGRHMFYCSALIYIRLKRCPLEIISLRALSVPPPRQRRTLESTIMDQIDHPATPGIISPTTQEQGLPEDGTTELEHRGVPAFPLLREDMNLNPDHRNSDLVSAISGDEETPNTTSEGLEIPGFTGFSQSPVLQPLHCPAAMINPNELAPPVSRSLR